jgi:hypothetical protein
MRTAAIHRAGEVPGTLRGVVPEIGEPGPADQPTGRPDESQPRPIEPGHPAHEPPPRHDILAGVCAGDPVRALLAWSSGSNDLLATPVSPESPGSSQNRAVIPWRHASDRHIRRGSDQRMRRGETHWISPRMAAAWNQLVPRRAQVMASNRAEFSSTRPFFRIASFALITITVASYPALYPALGGNGPRRLLSTNSSRA